ncbi:hypothetical protein GCM10027268_08820 [Brachybacterium huguangmaarense]
MDAVLGALNAAHLGEPAYAETLQSTIVLDVRTPDSLLPARRTDERPELQSSVWNSQAFFPVRRHGGMDNARGTAPFVQQISVRTVQTRRAWAPQRSLAAGPMRSCCS